MFQSIEFLFRISHKVISFNFVNLQESRHSCHPAARDPIRQRVEGLWHVDETHFDGNWQLSPIRDLASMKSTLSRCTWEQ